MFKLMVSWDCGYNYQCDMQSENVKDFAKRIKQLDRDMLRWGIMDVKYYTMKVDRLLRGKPCTETEALEMKHIELYAKLFPKRYVNIVNADGTKEFMTWGEYLIHCKKVRS